MQQSEGGQLAFLKLGDQLLNDSVYSTTNTHGTKWINIAGFNSLGC